MAVKRPAKRFTVLIEDGADELHFLCVRGHDQDGAIRQAVKRLRRNTAAKYAGIDHWASARRLKRLKMRRIFAGHVREIGKENIDVTNI